MLTNFKDAGDHVILNGAKMWISNAPFSQVAVVWAKNEAGDAQVEQSVARRVGELCARFPIYR